MVFMFSGNLRGHSTFHYSCSAHGYFYFLSQLKVMLKHFLFVQKLKSVTVTHVNNVFILDGTEKLCLWIY